MAKKERTRITAEDMKGEDLSSEGVERHDIVERLIGTISRSHGLESTDRPVPSEKALVYPTQGDRIVAGPPKEAFVNKESKDFIRFYDDRTENPDYSNEEMIAMAAIGLLTPLVGHALGGKAGAYAGGASAGKALYQGMKDRSDHYDKISAQKLINKSKVLTAMEVAELEKKYGIKSDKVKYQWLETWQDGKPVYVPVDRTSKEVDWSKAIPIYDNNTFGITPVTGGRPERQPPVITPENRSQTPVVTPQDPEPREPGYFLEQDTIQPGPPKTVTQPVDLDNVPDLTEALPEAAAGTPPRELPADTKKPPGKITAADAVNSAEILAEQRKADLQAQMPSVDDMMPRPRDGEAPVDAKARAEANKKLAEDLRDQIAKIDDKLLEFKLRAEEKADDRDWNREFAQVKEDMGVESFSKKRDIAIKKPLPLASQTPTKLEDQLRKERESHKITKETDAVEMSYARMKNTSPTPQGDMRLLYGYMRILDPNTGVKEGEYATATNAASIPDRVRNAYNKAVEGDLLNPDQRTQYMKEAAELVKQQREKQADYDKGIAEIARDRKIDPSKVIKNRNEGDLEDAIRGNIQVQKEKVIESKLPVIQEHGGKKYRFEWDEQQKKYINKGEVTK